ncbi:WD40/YVTN/BNR-like repeat-containing protein [Bacteroidota bacterium]
MKRFLLIIFALTLSFQIIAQDNDAEKPKDPMSSGTFSGLKFRSIGPAYCSGRISDFAVNPNNHSERYVAVASGHVWKTVNAGTTWEPIFDNYGAYAIGCVVIDPNNPHVIWIGTGENNHQRAIGYGDGVYKSIDGGKSFKNMGLKESRQIGMIAIDPRNSDIVFGAAQGSIWGPGGDRGLYKTTDGGKNWKKVLNISKNTGVYQVVYDPRDPDVMYATADQRRRDVGRKIGGGPESAVYKSYDGGETWEKIMEGLPKTDMGGMGLAISPVNPDYLYLIVSAFDNSGGFYRSTNRGATWEKMSDYNSSTNYYSEIIADPNYIDRVYSMDTWSRWTDDGGKTWTRISTDNRHVDDHAMWINPNESKHYLIGGDGGVYETYDQGKTFDFVENLPITQFYRVNVDNDFPFYNVYGGTQDNASMGGPSRTISSNGIVNSDWFVTNGGDGFWTAADPTDPNIVYAESQYGHMVRYDRKSGEAISIRPEPKKGENTFKWNWNTPLIISPHSPTRLYCAAEKVFRSDDRGDSWEIISDDLTAQVDRNSLPLMDKYWSVDAIEKNVSTSQWGMIISLSESPIKENLIFIGTDDGNVQRTEDAKTWTKLDDFDDLPKYAYVSDIVASRHDENVVYAVFNNLKRDNFKPYVYKSDDKGESWESISGNLPENGPVHTIVEDNINPDLLFVGTEFGVFFTVDGGRKWIQLKEGIPTIQIPDIVIQEREDDLVLATFGRGFYILDNYSPLRTVTSELLDSEAHLFPVKDTWMFFESRGRYGQGSNFFKAPNPEFGATFTYYLKEAPKTLKEIRHEKEKKLFKDGKFIPQPPVDELRKEEAEVKPYLIFTIIDAAGEIVRKITQPAKKGINRVNWDLRYESIEPISIKEDKFNPVAEPSTDKLAMPGKYSVAMSIVVRGEEKKLGEIREFIAKPLGNSSDPADNRADLVAFQQKAARLISAVRATEQFTEDLVTRVEYIKQALNATPKASFELMLKADALTKELNDVLFVFKGQQPKASFEELPPAQYPLNRRVSDIANSQWRSSSNVTTTMKQQYEALSEELPPLLEKVKSLYNSELQYLETQLQQLGAPYTPGRIPDWKE